MLSVRFYDSVEDGRLEFAVIAARCGGRWILCKHRERDTLECPGGHRELGESIEAAARRELWEETGASGCELKPVCAYSVDDGGAERFGMLYAALVDELGELPDMEIERVTLHDELPERWTYPLIQPKLLSRATPVLEAMERAAQPENQLGDH